MGVGVEWKGGPYVGGLKWGGRDPKWGALKIWGGGGG